MKTKVRRWGDSLAVRVPKSIVQQFRLRAGDEVEIIAQKGTVVLRAVRPQYELATLLSQIKPDTIHSETDWGIECGRELW